MARFDNRRVYKQDLYCRNNNIRAAEVRVINSDGTMVGILPIREAVAMAKEQELDLVEFLQTPNLLSVRYLITISMFMNRERKLLKRKRSKRKFR